MVDQLTIRVAPAKERFAALTTAIQLAAIAQRCERQTILKDLKALPSYASLTRRAGASDDTSRWLLNGWNTECLLRREREELKGDTLRHALHWAMPKVYYSAYASASAYYAATGHPEKTHAGAIRRFGKDAIAGRYPRGIAFAAMGGRTRQYYHVDPTVPQTSVHFDPTDPGVVDAHICKYLNATRRIDLQGRKEKIEIKTKSGKGVKRNLNAQDWEYLSGRLGPTSLMSVLYRKRLKANYRDIDTFLSPELDAPAAFWALVTIVGTVNLVHEAFVRRLIGDSAYSKIVATRVDSFPFTRKRLDSLRALEA